MDKFHNETPLPIQEAAKPTPDRNYGLLEVAEEQLDIILFEMAHSDEWFTEIKRGSKRSK